MPATEENYTIRSYRREDLPACRRLYVEGLIGGKIAENDTGLDIDDIDSAYMTPGNHFWVAEAADGEVVAMLGLQRTDNGAAEIRRLRVRKDFRRRGIGSKLMETALRFCHDNGYLKITLDTFMEREGAIKLFQKFRFRHSRSRTLGDKEMMYFYLDLYSGPARAEGGDGGETAMPPTN